MSVKPVNKFLFIIMLLIAAVGFATASASMSLSKSPIGTWTGKLKLTLSAQAKASASPQQLQAQEAIISKLKFTLTIKKGGTYSLTTTGFEAPPSSGKWKVKGSKITLISDKGTGQNKEMSGTISANGKTIKIAMPKNPQASGFIIFSR